MKKRHIVAVSILLLLIAVLLIRSNSDKPKTSEEPDSAIPIATTGTTNAKPFSGTNTSLNPNVEKVDLRKLDEDRRRRIEEGKDEWRAPINFFGKVVDENGTGVPNVQISFGWTDLSPTEGYSRAQTMSDADGLFSLLNRTGKHLSVSLAREGYYVSAADNKSFEYGDPYSRPNPQPGSPVIFHLRKKGQAEPLVAMQKNFRVARDGTPLEIDLLAGKAVPAGQGHLRIECWTRDQGKKRGEKHDWQCRVSIPGGGMLVNTNEFAFLAPESGYQESFEIVMPASLDREWKKDVQRELYFKLKDGKYGRMTFAMIAAGDHFCMVGALTNPSGSRNLEFDPAVQPKQTQFE